MHILVVEDDTVLARRIASTLTEAGHDPIVVHNGEKALDKTKATPFDLIVLDIILPGMDGFEVLRHLRAQHLASRVLMLTARGEVKDHIFDVKPKLRCRPGAVSAITGNLFSDKTPALPGAIYRCGSSFMKHVSKCPE